MEKRDIEKFKKLLEEEKEKILAQLKEIAKKEEGVWKASFPKSNGETSLERVADEVEEYSSRLSLGYNFKKRLKEINLALEKIERGDYGICEKCKKEIEKERLEANPAARFCLKCKK